MAEDKSDSQDKSQKTEEATAHQLLEARKKGQIPLSREVNHWMIILAITIIMGLLAPYSLMNVITALKPLLAADQFPLDNAGAIGGIVAGVVWSVMKSVALPFMALFIAGIAAGLAQTQFLVSAETLKPKLSKISIFGGIKRMFSLTNFTEFVKGMVKISLVSGVLYWVIRPELANIGSWASLSAHQILPTIQAILMRVLLVVLAIVGLVAGVDYFYQVYNHRQKLKMSKQDIKEEHKSLEGDPQIKRRLAELRRDRASAQRISTAVPDSTVIITNPTHYAVALKYEAENMDAPVCVAKGMDFLAARIRELANQHDIPMIEDPPLARALYASAEINESIPANYYYAVARVVRYITGLDKTYKSANLGEDK